MSRLFEGSERVSLLLLAMCLGFTGCIGKRLPVVEHPSYVSIPRDSARLASGGLKSDWDRHRRAGAHTRARAGADCGNCMVEVQITAVEGAKYVTSDKPPKKPQLLAWIENLDTIYREKVFKLKPSREAVYAVIADSILAPNKRTRLLLVEIPQSRSGGQVVYKTSGSIAQCHKYARPLASEADFRPCAGAVEPFTYPPPSRLFAPGPADVPLEVTIISEDPLWFSCNSGCCTGSFTTVVVQ